jgi:hypothetical protein
MLLARQGLAGLKVVDHAGSGAIARQVGEAPWRSFHFRRPRRTRTSSTRSRARARANHADLLLAQGLDLEIGGFPRCRRALNPKIMTGANGYLDCSASAPCSRPSGQPRRGDIHRQATALSLAIRGTAPFVGS